MFRVSHRLFFSDVMPSFFHWHLTVVDRVREEEKKKTWKARCWSHTAQVTSVTNELLRYIKKKNRSEPDGEAPPKKSKRAVLKKKKEKKKVHCHNDEWSKKKKRRQSQKHLLSFCSHHRWRILEKGLSIQATAPLSHETRTILWNRRRTLIHCSCPVNESREAQLHLCACCRRPHLIETHTERK